MTDTSMLAGPGSSVPVSGQSLGIGAPHRARTGPIVLAVHGGEPSVAAIIAAHLIAGRLRVPLRVLTVVEPVPIYTDALDPIPLSSVPWEELSERQEDAVRKEMRDAMVPDNEWTLHVRQGQAARLIAAFAEEEKASLVVIDAARRRGLRHPVSGMMALYVLRRASCPVLSVAAGATGLPRRIVAAIDFSPASIHAVEAALLIADPEAHLTLLHRPSPFHFDGTRRDKTGALHGADLGEVFSRLRAELAPRAPHAGVDVKIIQGNVSDIVLTEAEAASADLIVVGTHGPGPVERFFVGSTAANLLHLATCSVLASPPPSVAEYTRLELRMGDTVTSDEPRDWSEILDAFSARNAGRRVRLEVDDAAIGAQTEAQGYQLTGVTFDPAHGAVDIMLGDVAAHRSHITHHVEAVDSLGITATPAGLDSALRIVSGRSQTLLLFE